MLKSTRAFLPFLAVVLSSCTSRPTVPDHSGQHVAVVSLGSGVAPSRGRQIVAWLQRVRAPLDRDIGVRRGVLHVSVYATHRTFARALWRMQHGRAQGPTDNTGAIVHGRLLLGPEDPSYLRHNLTHIYTEWLLDRLVGNISDRLPAHTWLYDGIAEYEARRYTPLLTGCAGEDSGMLHVTDIRSPARWLAIRGGPLGEAEYCLAALRVQDIVRAVGWRCLVQSLGRRGLAPTAVILERRSIFALRCRTR